MPTIEPLSSDRLPPSFRQAIERNVASRNLSSDIQMRIWGRRPAVAEKWLGLLEELNVNSLLGERLRELVRLKIASITTCRACQIARKSDEVTEEDIACMTWSDPRFSPPEQAALRFAELFAGDYFSVDDEVLAGLRAHFSEEQIVELHLYAGMMLAGGRVAFVQRAYEDEESGEPGAAPRSAGAGA